MAREAAEVKKNVVAKAIRCIDEIYPAENPVDETFFSVDAFIEEAVRWVIEAVPTAMLSERETLVVTPQLSDDGVGSVNIIPPDFGRLVFFMAADWKRPVVSAITENSPLYLQQKNPVLRGNPSRPIVAIVEGRSRIEWYTTRTTGYEALYVPYKIEYIPQLLEDITAWKLAEIILLSMADTQSAAVCVSRVNEQLQMLNI